jgi:hypothetical protein
MAANCGGWGRAAVTERTQRAPLKAGNLRNEPNGVGRKVGKSRERTHRVGGVAPRPRERSHGHRVGKDCTGRRNRIIAGPQQDGANGQNKATIVGEEEIAPIWGDSADLWWPHQDRPSRPIVGPSDGRDRAPDPNFPGLPDGHAHKKVGQRTGATAAGVVRQDSSRRPGSGRSRGTRTASTTPTGRPVRRCGLTGPERWVGKPKDVRIVRARGNRPAVPPQGRDGTPASRAWLLTEASLVK